MAFAMRFMESLGGASSMDDEKKSSPTSHRTPASNENEEAAAICNRKEKKNKEFVENSEERMRGKLGRRGLWVASPFIVVKCALNRCTNH